MDNAQAEYLVDRYADLLLRIGRTWLGDLDDAKDICQIVLIKLLEHPVVFPDPGQERAWVVRIAVNECKNWKKSAWFRRHGHHGGRPAGSPADIQRKYQRRIQPADCCGSYHFRFRVRG